MAAWTLIIQSCIGVLTIAGSFLAVRLGAREAEHRSRREEWWRRYSWAVDSLNAPDRLKVAAGRAMLESLYSASLAGELERSVVLETMWTAVGASRPEGVYEDHRGDPYWYPYDSQARIARFLVHNDDRATHNTHLRDIAFRDAELRRMVAASNQLKAHDAIDFVHIRPFNGVFEIWVIYYLLSSSADIDVARLVRKMFPHQRFRLAQLDTLPLTGVGKLDEKTLTTYPIDPEWTQ